LEKNRSQFEAKGAKVVGLAYQNQSEAGQSANNAGTAYPILADADHKVADQFGVFNLLKDGVAAPAVFIIDRSGRIVWSHIGKNISDRPASKTILEKLPD
jgi:peroxiredoxin